MVTDRVTALMTGDPVATKKTTSGTEGVLEYTSYVAPEYFGGFACVLFLSALFEQTILYHLWTKALGVTYVAYMSQRGTVRICAKNGSDRDIAGFTGSYGFLVTSSS